jgi:two-component system nitrogen regulation sensor histidine kinase NtrY
VLSFLIIGAATISFFIARYQRSNVDKISRTAGIMVKELQKRSIDTSNNGNLFDSASIRNLQKLVNEVADIHGVDVNVYDLNGNLQVTSEDLVYQKGILSTKIHPAGVLSPRQASAGAACAGRKPQLIEVFEHLHRGAQ